MPTPRARRPCCSSIAWPSIPTCGTCRTSCRRPRRAVAPIVYENALPLDLFYILTAGDTEAGGELDSLATLGQAMQLLQGASDHHGARRAGRHRARDARSGHERGDEPDLEPVPDEELSDVGRVPGDARVDRSRCAASAGGAGHARAAPCGAHGPGSHPMSDPRFIGLPDVLDRRVLFAVELVDPVTQSITWRGLTVTADGIDGQANRQPLGTLRLAGREGRLAGRHHGGSGAHAVHAADAAGAAAAGRCPHRDRGRASRAHRARSDAGVSVRHRRHRRPGCARRSGWTFRMRLRCAAAIVQLAWHDAFTNVWRPGPPLPGEAWPQTGANGEFAALLRLIAQPRAGPGPVERPAQGARAGHPRPRDARHARQLSVSSECRRRGTRARGTAVVPRT